MSGVVYFLGSNECKFSFQGHHGLSYKIVEWVFGRLWQKSILTALAVIRMDIMNGWLKNVLNESFLFGQKPMSTSLIWLMINND